ncbi:MAG: LPS export ABC transporter periplasmic protein LptC [Candidatus Binataceae bacterium]
MSPRRIAKLLAGIGAVALTLLLGVTVVVVHHRSAEQKLVKAAAGVLPGSLLHARNFHWTQMKGDQSQWVLKAQDASYSDDRTGIILVKPELTMTAKDGKRVALTANLAKLKLSGNHITQANMTGALVMHYGDFVLTTDEASFLPDSDGIESDGPVRIEGPDVVVTGIGLSGHPNAQIFELRKQVTTRFTPREKSDKAKVS